MYFAQVFRPGETEEKKRGTKSYKAVIPAGEHEQGALQLSSVLRDEVPVMENRPKVFTRLPHLYILNWNRIYGETESEKVFLLNCVFSSYFA